MSASEKIGRPPALWVLFFVMQAIPQGLDLDKLIRLGMEKNPDLLISRQETTGAGQDTTTAAIPSNPILEADAFHNLSDGSKPKAGAKISKEFQPGVLEGKQNVARAKWASKREWQSVKELDVALAIRADYFDWQILNRKKALQRDVRERWAGLARLTSAKMAEGKLSQIDQAQAQLNLAHSKQKELETQSDMASQEKRLAYLVGLERLPDSLATMNTDSLPDLPPLDSVWSWVNRENPELKALDRDIALENERLALEQRLRNPSFSLSLNYDRETDGQNLVGGGIGIPLPLFNRNQAGVVAAKSSLRTSELKRIAAEQKLKTDLAEIHGKLIKLSERYRNYAGEIRDLSRKQMALSEQGFRQGVMSVLDLSKVQEESLNQELEALEILQVYHQLWNQLGRLVGGKTWQ